MSSHSKPVLVALARIPLSVVTLLMLMSCASMKSPPPSPMLGKGHWRSFDGKEMPWSAGYDVRGGRVKAVVITVHGLSGAASDFWMLEQSWPERGWEIYGMQLRGQGNDPVVRDRGDVAVAEVWQHDLLTFDRLVREKHPGVPVFWFAESLGTLIALHTLTDLMAEDPAQYPAGLIMSSPAVGLRIRPRGFRSTLINAMVWAWPGWKVNLGRLVGVDENKIQVTSDTTYGGQMAVTSHHVSRFSLRLLGEVDGMMKRAKPAAARCRAPVLVLASPHDVIASEKQIQAWYDQLASPDKEIHWYRESHHLLLHDREREQVLKDATAWLQARLARQKK